ncbi:MAG: efflux RND transporter periplasmic adaptor subunit [Isosphaeraceae bacterium]|nr:efflux RND transporter periplasmic adaptor subunit [Isosphaeraceae bacterium]
MSRGTTSQAAGGSVPLAPVSSSSLEELTAVRVDVVRPERGGMQRTTTQPGSIHAFETVDLHAKVSGFLQTQAVDIGDAVKDGQVLAEIEVPELDKDVEEAAATVEQSRARVEVARARVATAEAERDAAQAAVAQAEADIDRLVARRVLSEKQYERMKGLYARNAVDQRLVDEHQHARDSALAGERTGRAAAQTARVQVAAAIAKVNQAKADLADAEATVRVSEARLARARVVAGYAQIVAPFDGVIAHRYFFPGDFIRSAAEGAEVPLLTVLRTDKMRVVVQVPDRDVPLLDVGDPATMTVDALKGRSFRGAVARLARSEDPSTRSMRVEIDLPNPDGLLCAGMYGRVTIELSPPTQHLTIPAACLVGQSDPSGPSVYVVREGRAYRKSITVGDDDGIRIEVLSGLDADEEVVLRPGGSLTDGHPVIASSAPSAK